MQSKVRGGSGKLHVRFTQQKMLGLPLKQQHKKCATLLRLIYDRLLDDECYDDILIHYNEIQDWTASPPLLVVNPKNIADRFHEHLNIAELSLREHNLLPSITRMDKESASTPWPIAIYLDNIRSAYNVGSILRTVEGFSLGSVYFSEKTPFIDHKQVNDAAMGASQWVACEKVESLSKLPRPFVLLETSPDALPMHDFIFPDTFTLIVGNEEYGCSETVLSQADYLITIPMRGHKNSLNVANAFAMAAHEITRQRTKSLGIEQEA